MLTPRPPVVRGMRKLLRLGSSVVGAALVGAIGWVLAQTSLSVGTFGERIPSRFGWLSTSLGESLARLSFDLPFIFRGTEAMQKSCIVYMDENSARQLEQTGAIWDRKLHVDLLNALAEDKPRAVFFDVIFSDEWAVPGVDEAFAEAIEKCGNVFLAGALESDAGMVGAGGFRVASQRVIPPIATLRRAAEGWGVIAFQPIDGDYGVRRISPGTENVPSAPWRAAVKLGAPLEDAPESWLKPRWQNFYGPAGLSESVGYDRVIGKNRVAPGYFKDRIVVVAGRSTLGGLAFGKDDFRNPYSLLGGGFSTGAEIHLTALLNLLNGEFLTRLDVHRELWTAVIFGIVLGGLLPRFRPHLATLLAVAAIVGVGLFALWMNVAHRVWFAWCVPALVQTPLALFWAVGARYFLEERRRSELRKAFGHYISPHIADRIADTDFDLSPGGSVMEVTVLFTDLEGFTTLAEELKHPEQMTRILLKYFAQTTEPILDNEGTIINFVGDAVTAVWGAPLADPEQARKAALAAWRLHESAHSEVDGHKLRTRVGLHAGRVFAGNVGAAKRFDYAVVGDPVNFASRLEGLNKYFGTNVLISEAIRAKLGGEFISRQLGEVRVVGKTETYLIHEFLGPATGRDRAGWCGVFEKGVEAFCSGDLAIAERQMRETLALRGGSDGPSEFYLSRIAALKSAPLPEGWKGVLEFGQK